VTPSCHLVGAIGTTPPSWLPFKGIVNYYTTKLFNQRFHNQQAIGNEHVKNKASLIGQQIRAEDGVEASVSMIERFVRAGDL
jgi:hypothetical protein